VNPRSRSCSGDSQARKCFFSGGPASGQSLSRWGPLLNYVDCEWVLREGVLAREFPEFEMTTVNEAALVAQVLEATGKFDAVHIMTGTREELRAAIKKHLEDSPPERFISVQQTRTPEYNGPAYHKECVTLLHARAEHTNWLKIRNRSCLYAATVHHPRPRG
jgi:hypothetical protein